MNTTTVPPGLNQAEADRELDSGTMAGLTTADGIAADRLEHLSLVHQARISQLSRTVMSLTAEYGEGSTQVVAAQAAVTAAAGIVTRVEIVRQQTAAAAPKVTSTGWAVWGHVYDSNSKPLSGYCVFLVDRQKNYQNAYGFVFTDGTGSFAINYEGGSATGKSSASTPTVYLAITNAKAQLVFEGSEPLSLTVGSALYVDTTLPPGEPVLGDLPQEIQKVAVPPTSKY
jgi:hypothetical protein